MIGNKRQHNRKYYDGVMRITLDNTPANNKCEYKGFEMLWDSKTRKCYFKTASGTELVRGTKTIYFELPYNNYEVINKNFDPDITTKKAIYVDFI